MFSKKVLLAIFIFLNFNSIEHNFNPPSLGSSKIYQSCMNKLDNLIFLKYSSPIAGFVLILKGDSDKPIT